MDLNPLKNRRILPSSTWEKLANLIKDKPVANPKPGVTGSLRGYVIHRDESRCVYCKSDLDLQCDHVIPVSHGGPPIQENLVTACKKCNEAKTNSFDVEYLVIAFNHLLTVGETLDWIDLIFCDSIDNLDLSTLERVNEWIDDCNNLGQLQVKIDEAIHRLKE